jgi:hypothetical protein
MVPSSPTPTIPLNVLTQKLTDGDFQAVLANAWQRQADGLQGRQIKESRSIVLLHAQ